MGRLVGRHGHLDPGLWKPARINANYAAICEVPVLGWHLFTSKWRTETSIKPGNKTLTLLKKEIIGKSIDSDDGWWITAVEDIVVICEAGWNLGVKTSSRTLIAQTEGGRERLITVSEMLYTVHPRWKCLIDPSTLSAQSFLSWNPNSAYVCDKCP